MSSYNLVYVISQRFYLIILILIWFYIKPLLSTLSQSRGNSSVEIKNYFYQQYHLSFQNCYECDDNTLLARHKKLSSPKVNVSLKLFTYMQYVKELQTT